MITVSEVSCEITVRGTNLKQINKLNEHYKYVYHQSWSVIFTCWKQKKWWERSPHFFFQLRKSNF